MTTHVFDLAEPVIYFSIGARIARFCINKYDAVLQDNMAKKNDPMNISSRIMKYCTQNPNDICDSLFGFACCIFGNISERERG
jgi:hypothetical protein